MARRTRAMQPKRLLPQCLCSCCVCVFLLVSGFVAFFIWPLLVSYILETNMVLEPGSHTFELWRKLPVPLSIDFYFFNWTNPQDVYNASCKPAFEEIGPYRFSETKEKVNVTWNDGNGTVSFRHLRRWYHDGESVENHLSDRVVTANPVSLSAVHAARSWSYLVRKGLSLSLSAGLTTIQINRSVGQMLFEGYPDSLIDMAKSIPFLSGEFMPPWDRFGWFYTRNGSVEFDGLFNMGTGKNSEFGKLYKWNHWSQTPYLEGGCGMINGSAGEFFPPAAKLKHLYFFSPDMCRSVKLDFVGESVVNNILGHKYAAGEGMFDNGTKVPDNKCFCNGECVPSGTANISSCRYGSPSFASLPHFNNADPYYTDAVHGLKPDKNKHEFFITLEPTTGIPLEVAARLQVNLLMQPVAGISIYENAPRVFFPMLWFEQKAKIPDREAFLLKLLLNLPIICQSLGIILISMALLVGTCFAYKLCTANICGRKKPPQFMYAEQEVPLKHEHRMEIFRKV